MGKRLGGWALCALGMAIAGTLACIEPPPVPERRDAGMDAPVVVPLEVTAIYVEAIDHMRWPDEAIPRRPRVVIETSRDLDEGAPVYLLYGETTDALIEDAQASPLRSEHLTWSIAVAEHREHQRIELVPEELFWPGDVVTLVIGGWAESEGLELGAPVVRTFVVSDALGAGAEATESWPADGTSDVPVVVPSMMVRFDGALGSIADAFTLIGPDGDPIEGTTSNVDCGRYGLEGVCVALRGVPTLEPFAEHELRVAGALDATGATMPAWSARFRTGEDVAREPPAAIASDVCAIDETVTELGCVVTSDEGVSLALHADRAVIASLEIGVRRATALAPRGDVRLTIDGLGPDTAYEATLALTDVGGARSEQTVTIATRPALPRVVITEVRADPLGREPTQEYVELLNDGPTAVDLSGWFLTDALDEEGDVIGSATIGPGDRVLLVSDGFDAEDESDDPPVPAGARLLRIGASLGAAGLGNAGEVVVLRDPEGARISLVPAIASEPGYCIARVTDDPRSEDVAHYDVTDCTPGE